MLRNVHTVGSAMVVYKLWLEYGCCVTSDDQVDIREIAQHIAQVFRNFIFFFSTDKYDLHMMCIN